MMINSQTPPSGATHYCMPYFYRIAHNTVFKWDRGGWEPSLFDPKTLTSEPDCEKVRS